MIAIGADHAGFELKEEIKNHLKELDVSYKDFGTFSKDSCDYPLIAKTVCEFIVSGGCEKGILICGTGIGICIAANKIRNIRAALCTDEFSAEMARKHNDANVMCVGSKALTLEKFKKMINIFLSTDFEGDRHTKRLNQIADIENNNM